MSATFSRKRRSCQPALNQDANQQQILFVKSKTLIKKLQIITKKKICSAMTKKKPL